MVYQNDVKSQLMQLNGFVNGKIIRFILDTGANSSVISETWIDAHNIQLERCNGRLEVANCTTAEFQWKTKPVDV